MITEFAGQGVDVNGFPVWLDVSASASIPYVMLRDGRVLRGVVIDPGTMQPRFLGSEPADRRPVLFDPHTSRTYAQDNKQPTTSDRAYYLASC